MRFRLLLAALMIALCSYVIPTTVSAQTSRGTVNGIITDQTGAVVSGASVTLTNTGTNVQRTTTTNQWFGHFLGWHQP